MNILLITGPYPPEIRAISFMMKELADELVFRGHRVTVVTSWPQHNLSDDGEKRKFSVFEDEDGVRVIRVKTPLAYCRNFLLRGLGQLATPHFFLKKIKKSIKHKIDKVIVYSPPLPLALVGIRIKKIYGAKYLLNIQDIFPQNAIDLGILRNKLLIRFFERMERRAYENADRITSHTINSRKFLVDKKNVPEQKISTIHNWIDVHIFKCAESGGRFRERYGLRCKFIFLFAGIIGPAQGLKFIIRLAKKVKDLKEIYFVIVGDGSEKATLQNMVREYCLENVQFYPFVSKKRYPELAKEANVGLACLSIKNKTPVIPGKILSFMASAIPVVAFLNEESDAHELIRESLCGYSATSNDLNVAEKLIRKIFNERDKIGEYGQNGLNYAMANFDKKICIDKIEQLIQ